MGIIVIPLYEYIGSSRLTLEEALFVATNSNIFHLVFVHRRYPHLVSQPLAGRWAYQNSACP